MADDIAIDALIALVEEAGRAVLAHYGRAVATRAKADRSPVTEADLAAEAILVAGLERLCPAVPVIAEERVAQGVVPEVTGGRLWLVDPLDGTREFLSRNGEFTVNVALVEDGVPVLGVVGAPALGRLWWGGQGRGAFRREGGREMAVRARRAPPSGPVAVISRSHLDEQTVAYLDKLGAHERRSIGSSLKFCLLAEGEADVYPRFGTTMEWDTAAGDTVLRAAGGRTTTADGRPLVYNKPGFKNPPFIAFGA